MLKRINNLKKGTMAGVSASIYTLLVFPGYLQVAEAAHDEAKCFCCVGVMVVAAMNVLWTGVSIFRQVYKTHQ